MPVRRKARRCTRRRIGRVSAYLHHGAWWIYYRDGSRQVRRRIGDDRDAAERVAAQVNAQLSAAAPTMFAFTPVSVGELRESFLRHHDQVLRSSVATVRRYSAATQHLAAFGESRPAHEISATDFISHLRSLPVSPNGHIHTAKRLLRDKGVRFIAEVCRAMYSYAARQRHLPPYAANPFADLRLDRMRIEDAKPVFVFDAETELRFLHAAKAWEFPIHFLMAKTGLRPGELCHLLVGDVDLENGWLHVRGKPELGWQVKTRNARRVPLIGEVRDLLRLIIGGRAAGPVFRRPQFRQVAGHDGNLQALLQQPGQVKELSRDAWSRVARGAWRDAGAFDADQIRRSFIRVARRAGLNEATCSKSWRHTFATLLQDANVDPLIRQITLGHQPTNGSGALGMTGVYSHSRPNTQVREITKAMQLWPESLELARHRAQGGAA